MKKTSTSKGLLRRHAAYGQLIARNRSREAQARRALAEAMKAEHARGVPYNVMAVDLGVTRQRAHQMANES